jgi:hypothetical protein
VVELEARRPSSSSPNETDLRAPNRAPSPQHGQTTRYRTGRRDAWTPPHTSRDGRAGGARLLSPQRVPGAPTSKIQKGSASRWHWYSGDSTQPLAFWYLFHGGSSQVCVCIIYYNRPPPGFEADLIHLERVHLKLLPEGPHREEPVSQRRISDFQTRFAMETQHHPCPPPLAKDRCSVFKLLEGRLCLHPGFCNAMGEYLTWHLTAQVLIGSVDVFLASIKGSL